MAKFDRLRVSSAGLSSVADASLVPNEPDHQREDQEEAPGRRESETGEPQPVVIASIRRREKSRRGANPTDGDNALVSVHSPALQPGCNQVKKRASHANGAQLV